MKPVLLFQRLVAAVLFFGHIQNVETPAWSYAKFGRIPSSPLPPPHTHTDTRTRPYYSEENQVEWDLSRTLHLQHFETILCRMRLAGLLVPSVHSACSRFRLAFRRRGKHVALAVASVLLGLQAALSYLWRPPPAPSDSISPPAAAPLRCGRGSGSWRCSTLSQERSRRLRSGGVARVRGEDWACVTAGHGPNPGGFCFGCPCKPT